MNKKEKYEDVKDALAKCEAYMEKINFQNREELEGTYVYKYIPFDDHALERIKSIKEDKCWFSKRTELNDPFEGNYHYIDRQRLYNSNWPEGSIEQYESLLKYAIDSILTCSFTRKKNNFPMWYSYANRYNGCCVEYKVVNTSRFYKIKYDKRRMKFATIFSWLQFEELIPNVINVLIYFSQYKHKDWAYEEELRAYDITSSVDFEKKGHLIDNREIGVELQGIYIGNQCSEELYEKIFNENKNKNINIYKMDKKIDSRDFEMIYTQIKHKEE